MASVIERIDPKLSGIIFKNETASGKIQNDKDLSGSLFDKDKLCGQIPRTVSFGIRELVFKTYKDFPKIGDEEHLYIDTGSEHNIIYRFDKTQNIYVKCGTDVDDVDSIKCKLKEE